VNKQRGLLGTVHDCIIRHDVALYIVRPFERRPRVINIYCGIFNNGRLLGYNCKLKEQPSVPRRVLASN
jgi:hypothetical protein